MTFIKETIFFLEGRGGMYLYHFFIYNLGGLYYILNKEYNNRNNDCFLLEDKSKVVSEPSQPLEFPIKIHMTNVLPFQREAFEIIKEKFVLIEDLSTIENYEIVSIYGETLKKGIVTGDNSEVVLPFLRNLFLEKSNYEMVKGKKIFITRKNNEIYHQGVSKRFIFNEEELKSMLQKYDFEYIQLEDYSCREKIKIFMESEIILSTHSGALTFTLFANKNAKIIEICNKGTQGFDHSAYINIAKYIGLNHRLYSNINEDTNGNFEINVEEFEKYLLTIL
jgi:hypothetical protein